MNKQITKTQVRKLSEALWQHYDEAGRHDLPWRKTVSPYRVVVSEIMLQQTQVVRVETYFKAWMKRYPSWCTLAAAPLKDILLSWQGLGYNRRGKYLHDVAKIVTKEYRGKLPHDRNTLEALPGIGHYTAGSIRAFAFNEPDVFLETNIRTVLFYHFYRWQAQFIKSVPDQELMAVLEKFIKSDERAEAHPRELYYALMDYGSHLKTTVGNLNRNSKSYTKQSKFEGSRRQLRSQILRFILKEGSATEANIVKATRSEEALTKTLLQELIKEGSIKKQRNCYLI